MQKMERKLEQKLELKERMNKKYKILLLTIVVISLIVLFFSFQDEKTYVLKRYNAKTKDTTTFEYIIKDGDSIFQGKFVRYNEMGRKIAEGNLVDGDMRGKSIYYFENGTIASIYYYKNSKIIEENTDNYPSGKIMQYTLYDYFGLSAFIARFDEQGRIENYEGYPLMETYQYRIANKERFKTKINQYLKVGDTLKHQYLIANIPNAKRSFKIENVGVDDAKVKRIFKKVSQVGIDVKEVLTKKGINTIRAVVKYEFNDKEKTVINDTITFKVKVN